MKKSYYILLILLFTLLFSNSRVSFLRPGAFMRASNYEAYNANKLFSVGIGSEITSIGEITSHSSSFAFNKTNTNGTSWGFSYTVLPYTGIDPELANSDIKYEIGAHFQSNIYSTGKTNITAGIHDFLLNDNEMIALKDLSLFMNFSNTASINKYSLESLVGFGSGRLAFDPHSGPTSSSSLGVYAALKLNTPLLSNWGGVNFITEFLHGGLNLGVSIPFTNEYNLSVGITHIENLSNFSSQSANPAEELTKDAPAFCVGLGIDLPRINNQKVRKIAQEYPVLFINGRVDSSLFEAGEYIYFLQDSLSLLKQKINQVAGDNIALKLQNQSYQDSLNSLILESNINIDKHNKSMRHLSASLRFYYQGNFQQSLQEVEAAILLQPNTAVAYARKGSIYYKLNQLDRATLNWNIALKLDPEYTEVRDMLNALKENKLRPLTTN
jgi:hypothetical protein